MSTPTHTREYSLRFKTIKKAKSSEQPVNIIPNTVYITEIHQEVQMPQGFDQNPQYIEMYQNQLQAENYISQTGIINDNADEANERNEIIRQQKQRQLELERQRHLAEERRHERMIRLRLLQQQRQEEQQRESIQRKYTNMLKKIAFNEPFQDYYDSIPIQPGQNFYQLLLANQRHPPTHLNLNIPDMLIISDDVYWVNTNQQTGKIEVKAEFNSLQFYQTIMPKKIKSDDQIVAIWRMRSNKHQDWSFQPLNWLKFSEKVLKGNLPSVSVIFKLIKCNSDRPTVTRIFYQNSTKQCKASFGFQVTSTKDAIKRNKMAQDVLCVDMINGVEAFKITTSAVKQFEEPCQQIIEFLQSTYRVIIEEIVLDFIKGKDGKIWLFGCEGIKLDDNALAAQRQLDNDLLNMSKEQIKVHQNAKREQRLSAMHCKLCLLYYKTFEIQKMLPFKMLLLYKQHTQRSCRNILDLSHLRVLSVDFLSHWVRVCDICYMLVLSEYELMEVEQQLSTILNVPIVQEDLLSKPHFEHPAYMPDIMNQWRLLFYFQAIKYYKQSVIKHDLYLQYKIFDNYYSYRLESKGQRQNYIEYKLARLYYFFGYRDGKIVNLCDTVEMELRITNGSDWENHIASTVTNPLCLFSGKMHSNTAYIQPIFLTFFNGKNQIAKLKLQVGISCDKEIHAKQLPINIRRHKGLYFPDEWYINSDTLPSAWMEIFDQSFSGLSDSKVLDTSQEFEELYTPQLNEEQIMSRTLGNTKVLHLNFELDPLKTMKLQKEVIKKYPNQKQKQISQQLTPSNTSQRSIHQVHQKKAKVKSPTFSYQGSTKSTCQVFFSNTKRNAYDTPAMISNRPMTAPQSRSLDISGLNLSNIEFVKPTLNEQTQSIQMMNDKVNQYLSQKQKLKSEQQPYYNYVTRKSSKKKIQQKTHWFVQDLFSPKSQPLKKRTLDKLTSLKSVSKKKKKNRLKMIKNTYKSTVTLHKTKTSSNTIRF